MSDHPPVTKSAATSERRLKYIVVGVLVAMFYPFAVYTFPSLVLFVPLLTGWIKFPLHVIPNIPISTSLLAFFCCCVAGVIVGLHRFIIWLRTPPAVPAPMREGVLLEPLPDPPPFDEPPTAPLESWRWRWTLGFVLLGCVVLSQLICAGLVFHQIGWLMTHRRPLHAQDSIIEASPPAHKPRHDRMYGMILSASLRHSLGSDEITRGITRDQAYTALIKLDDEYAAMRADCYRLAFFFSPSGRLHSWLAIPRAPYLIELHPYAFGADNTNQLSVPLSEVDAMLAKMEQAALNAM